MEDYDADIYKSSHTNLNFASGVLPLSVGSKNLVAGIAYQQVLDLYNKYEVDTYTWEQTGGAYAITPAIGFQLTPIISLGAAVNIYTGKAVATHRYTSSSMTDRDEEFIFSGTNFNIGTLLDFNKFRIGGVLKTPFGLKQEYEGLESEKPRYDNTFGMPQILGFGASFTATENLTIAADYEMRNYSDSELTDNESDEKSPLEWEDINQFRLGAEYMLRSGTNILPIRLGFATTPTLTVDEEDEQTTGINLTAGIGIIVGNINLDLGVEYNTYPYELTDLEKNTYDLSHNYLRFIFAGVFHFGK